MHRQSSLLSGHFTTDEKYKTPVKASSASAFSNDKMSSVQFYTSKQVAARGVINNAQRLNLLPLNRTPIKRYFSENTLSQATPDCFNTVHVETPYSKGSDGVFDDQTLLDGENSNLTVGIRIRPLNAK